MKKRISLLTVSFLLIATSALAKQGYGFGPTESISSELCANGSDEHLDDGASNWKNRINDDSAWATTTWDAFIQGVEFCDVSLSAGCHDQDDSNFDAGDAAFLMTHGHWSDSIYNLKMSSEIANRPIPGSSGDDLCYAASSYWKIGNNNVEMAHVLA